MKKYKAFISYRKSYDVSAELVKRTLVEEYGFSEKSIFLDKHDIGPELFDTKIKSAVEHSSCLVLIVTKDCFIPKSDNDDWYIKEIQTALDNGITIIPLLFDGIKTLKQDSIIDELSKSFNKEEVDKLTKFQAVPYDFDLSDASFSKLSTFIQQTNKSTTSKIKGFTMAISAILAVLLIVFALFVGIGFLWGYFTSGTDESEILTDNVRIEGNSAIFEFGGLEAKYDLDVDSIYIDLSNFNGELPESKFEILAHSCSVTGAIFLFNKNISNLKYLKWLKGGSKQSKMAMAGITVAACIGSFCGFSQGSQWGRTLKQQNQALSLFPKLKNKLTWSPVFKENFLLNLKYYNNLNKNLQTTQHINSDALKSINAITFIEPDSEIKIAEDAGLSQLSILCRYNDWEIGKNTAEELNNEIEKSRNLNKTVIFMEVDSSKYEIKEINLPPGTVGILFHPPTKTTSIEVAIELYNEWKMENLSDVTK